jgi:peptide deformylase
MAVREILRMGDSRLLARAKNVTEFNQSDLDQLLVDMWDTMRAASGVGLAAPQIGVDWRVLVFGAEDNPRYPEAEKVPFTVLINPVLTPLTEQLQDDWEGCLSVPGMRGEVTRFTELRYQGYDQFGAPIDRTVSGFHARVVQHECDHLDGILYPMRIQNMRKFGYTEALFPDSELKKHT